MTELETLRQQLAAAEAARKDISEMLDRERERTDQFDWETGECTHGLIGNYHTCNGSKNGCERSRFLHCCHCMKKNFAAEAARKEAEQERDRATLSEDALQEKVNTMADAMNELGLTCGCSVDRPGDLCMHHSPRLLVAVKRAEAAERERDAARCDVAHAQFDRDAALNLVESAEALRDSGPSSAIVEAQYPYMCRIGHAQIGHSTDGESCPVCVEKGKTRFAAAEAAGLRKASGMMRDELMRLHEIICEEDAQSIEILIKETDALMNVPASSAAILAVVEAARAVADDYIIPSSLILALRKALCAIDGGSHV